MSEEAELHAQLQSLLERQAREMNVPPGTWFELSQHLTFKREGETLAFMRGGLRITAVEQVGPTKRRPRWKFWEARKRDE